MGLLGPVVALVLPKDMSPFWTLAPMLVWFAVFFPQAHKEERFLFPVYPVICLSGAYALVAIEDVVRQLRHHFGPFLAHFPSSAPPHTRCVI